MLMTDANPFIERFHDRMPVILHKRDFDEWLNEPAKELLMLYTGDIIATAVSEPSVKPVKKKKDPEQTQGELF